MKKELIQCIRIKIAISLNELLVTSKDFSRRNVEVDEIAQSYNQIALNADVRKATVSDTFNAKSIPNTTTLILIIEAMGYSLNDFAKIYDLISDADIKKFKTIKAELK